MAGHSKWAQIKRKKAVTDARRGQLWTRLLKEITVAARIGGGDPDGNARLRTAIQDARTNNVPNDNIDRAVKRGTGELDGVAYEEVTYEGYGPGGAAVLIETVTDNKNRTVAEIRHLFSKHGGNLSESGSVAWMFVSRGYFAIEKETMAEDEFMELALSVNAEDIATEDETYEIFTSPEAFAATKDALGGHEIALATSELARIPQNYTELESGAVESNLRLLEALEDHDDVQNVWTNFSFDSESVEALSD
ncbi:MAG: YebC/PmpR family DNA-binding transcriptional regulator [Acidobacteriota bacterium]|nr:YebC/PmpR family DNA-binding transcriptional regulator [Acidobacteriota bacterium]